MSIYDFFTIRNLEKENTNRQNKQRTKTKQKPLSQGSVIKEVHV